MARRNLVPPRARDLFPEGYRVLQGKQEFVTYPDNATIRVWHGETPDAFSVHWHTAAEILMVLEGECVVGSEGRRYAAHADDVVITPPRCPHELRMGEGGKRCLILFETEAFEQMRDLAPALRAMKEPIFVEARAAHESGLLMTLNQVVSLYRFHEPMWNTLCYSLLLRVFGKLGQYMAMEEEERPDAERLASSPQMMEGVLGFIAQNYMNDLTLEQAAAFAGYSKYYFARVFRQYTGTPFMQYLTRVRVANVRRMLVEGRESVGEIYARSGFSSLSTFNRAFKAANGCTPSEYRAIYSRRRKALDDAALRE